MYQYTTVAAELKSEDNMAMRRVAGLLQGGTYHNGGGQTLQLRRRVLVWADLCTQILVINRARAT